MLNTNMKNLLVLKHYKIKNFTGWYPDTEKGSPSDDYIVRSKKNFVPLYEEMKLMCIASARKNIIGLDDIIVHESEVDNIQEGFKQHFYDLYDLWKQGSVNILYADLDVLFTREFNWFEFTKKFVMYDATNSGIRYHGHDMSEHLWDIAFDLCNNWNPHKWDYEQTIYMKMVHDQINWPHQQQKLMEYGELVVNLPNYNKPHPIKLHDTLINSRAMHFHCSRQYIQFHRMRLMYDYLKI